jgi:hypothetical protein
LKVVAAEFASSALRCFIRTRFDHSCTACRRWFVGLPSKLRLMRWLELIQLIALP